MKITKITAQKRPGRYNIFVDDQFAFAVGENVLIQFHLIKDQVLTPEQAEQIQQSEQKDYAYNQALNYLSYQLRSIAEVKTYLKCQDIDAPTITEIITKLEKNHYLDDLQYAESFVRTEFKTTLDGPKKIQHKLQQKYIAPALIQQALLLYTTEQQVINATKLAQKCWRQNQQHPHKRRLQKVLQRLIAAGFSSEINQLVLQDLPQIKDDMQEQELLQKTLQKLWPRYQAKDQGRNKLYAALLRRGFTSDQIRPQLENLK